jgi:uncharacterized protein YegL
MTDLSFHDSDLVTNPTARIPVCLCLDVSGSMQGAPIAELARGVELFFEAVRADEMASHAVEIALVTFGPSRLALDFAPVDKQTVPAFAAVGDTPMGTAVLTALDALERRKTEYRAAGVDYFQPWLVLMTDGQPTDSIDTAAARTSGLVQARKLTVFPIGIGPSADLGTLARFSPGRAPLQLQGLRFADFFHWLSKSVARVSQSVPGQSVPLPAPSGWAQV